MNIKDSIFILVSLTPIYYPAYLIVMDLHVLFEVGAGGKGFGAELAGVGLLARVDALVTDQVTYLQKKGE
jgi:hypothetical protein